MQAELARLHFFAGKLSLFALHFVGAEQSPAPTERIPKAPLAGADSPYQGEMSRRDKRGRELSAKQTERLSQIRLNLSGSASPSQLPWEGRLWTAPSPHRGRLFFFSAKNLYNFNAQFSPFCGQFSCLFHRRPATMETVRKECRRSGTGAQPPARLQDGSRLRPARSEFARCKSKTFRFPQAGKHAAGERGM